jgi:N-methylhydantoinase A
LEQATGELRAAGVPDEQMRFEWLLNLVYPGQTFDAGIPIEAIDARRPLTMADVEATVEEFHRRNEAARLIEARAQEPTVRGVRLVATGLVPQPQVAPRSAGGKVEAVGARSAYVGGAWHDDVPVYAGASLPAGAHVDGPAFIAQPFTTIVLRPGDSAAVRDNGDILIAVGDTGS